MVITTGKSWPPFQRCILYPSICASWALMMEIRLFFCRNLLAASYPKNHDTLAPHCPSTLHPGDPSPTQPCRSTTSHKISHSWEDHGTGPTFWYPLTTMIGKLLPILIPVRCHHVSQWTYHWWRMRGATNQTSPWIHHTSPDRTCRDTHPWSWRRMWAAYTRGCHAERRSC